MTTNEELAAKVDALTAERDRYREAAQTSDSDAENEAERMCDRVVALESERDALLAQVDAQRRTMARAGAEIPAALAPLTAWGPPMPCVGRVLAMADGLAREGSGR